MNLANLMMGYSHCILTKELEGDFERRIQEATKYGKREIKEEKQGKMKLHIFKVNTASLYDIYLSLNEDVDEQNNEYYAIRNISDKDMHELINQLKNLELNQ